MMFLRENRQEALLQAGERKTRTGAQHRLWPLTPSSPASHVSGSSLKTQQTSARFQLRLGKVSEGPTGPEGDKLWRQRSDGKWGPFYLCSQTSTSAYLGTLLWGPSPPPRQFQTLPVSSDKHNFCHSGEKKQICFEGEIFRERSIAFLEKTEPEAYSSPPAPPSEMPRSSEKIADGTVHLQRSGSRRTLP